ncbi:unnamed protein product [Rangifer tarandus platyrhynchus]|uniref:Uncharacterized protein n=1 Tax=Rangifer tarandus platyrhynchus TaxID=3082113 RepID=A0ABN8YT29_RANTA|nr:unnamed protein product [Rangifer tarandus platyrhynchus]
MSDHGWDSGKRQVEEEEISGESRRQGKQEGKEVAISTHLFEAKHQVADDESNCGWCPGARSSARPTLHVHRRCGESGNLKRKKPERLSRCAQAGAAGAGAPRSPGPLRARLPVLVRTPAPRVQAAAQPQRDGRQPPELVGENRGQLCAPRCWAEAPGPLPPGLRIEEGAGAGAVCPRAESVVSGTASPFQARGRATPQRFGARDPCPSRRVDCGLAPTEPGAGADFPSLGRGYHPVPVEDPEGEIVSRRKLETRNYSSGNREPAYPWPLTCGASSGAGFRGAVWAPSPGGDSQTRRRRGECGGAGERGLRRAGLQGPGTEFLVLRESTWKWSG